MVTALYQQCIARGNAATATDVPATATKEQYLALCRADTHRAIAAYACDHPDASEAQLLAVVGAEVALFKAKIAAVCGSGSRGGGSSSSKKRRERNREKRQQRRLKRGSTTPASTTTTTTTSEDNAAGQNKYEGVWLQANTESVLLAGESSSAQNAGELADKAAVFFLEARTELSRATLNELVLLLKSAESESSRASFSREDFFVLLRSVAHVQAGKPPAAAVVSAASSSTFMRRMEPQLHLTMAKRVHSPSAFGAGGAQKPARSGAAVSEV